MGGMLATSVLVCGGGWDTHVGGVSRVSLPEGTGDGNRGGVRAAATSHLDLGARDVELGNASGPWVVDTQGLNAEQVLSIGNARWDVCRVATVQLPARAAAADRRAWSSY
jgi:hypothetical protein